MKNILSPDDIASKLANPSDSETGEYIAQISGFKKFKSDEKEPPSVILGSRSPRRELILRDLIRIKHKCFILDVNEDLPNDKYMPEVISKCLTTQKLLGYLQNREILMEKGNILIVSDTIVVGKNGGIMGKEPEQLQNDDEKFEFCRERIMQFLGSETNVFTSLAIADFRTGKILIGCDSVIIHFKSSGDDEKRIVERYCRHIYDKEMIKNHRGPLGKAGSFGIQESEILCLVEKVEGDITVAVGLPANLTLSLLNSLPGFSMPEKYDPERCINTIFANAVLNKTVCGKEIHKHVLKLITG